MFARAALAGALFAAPALPDIAWITNQSSGDVSVVNLTSGQMVVEHSTDKKVLPTA